MVGVLGATPRCNTDLVRRGYKSLPRVGGHAEMAERTSPALDGLATTYGLANRPEHSSGLRSKKSCPACCHYTTTSEEMDGIRTRASETFGAPCRISTGKPTGLNCRGMVVPVNGAKW